MIETAAAHHAGKKNRKHNENANSRSKIGLAGLETSQASFSGKASFAGCGNWLGLFF
jgi:hypothetical protein